MYILSPLILVSLFWTSLFLPVEKLPDPNETLRKHVYQMHTSEFSREEVERAMKNGADVNTYSVNYEGRPTGHSLLFRAVILQDYDSVKWLVQSGAVVTLEKGALSPIHVACKVGNYEIAHFLITTNRTWLEVTAKNSWTPLHLACMNGNQQIVELLLKYKSSFVYNRDGDGFTPLDKACENGHCHLIDLFNKANPHFIYWQSGYTSLHNAVVYNQLEVVKRLIELNPMVKIKGWTSEMEAALNIAKTSKKYAQIVIYLQSLKDKLPLYPRTPLEMCEALFANGATKKLVAQWLVGTIPDAFPYAISLLTESDADPRKVVAVMEIFDRANNYQDLFF